MRPDLIAMLAEARDRKRTAVYELERAIAYASEQGASCSDIGYVVWSAPETVRTIANRVISERHRDRLSA